MANLLQKPFTMRGEQSLILTHMMRIWSCLVAMVTTAHMYGPGRPWRALKQREVSSVITAPSTCRGGGREGQGAGLTPQDERWAEVVSRGGEEVRLASLPSPLHAGTCPWLCPLALPVALVLVGAYTQGRERGGGCEEQKTGHVMWTTHSPRLWRSESRV